VVEIESPWTFARRITMTEGMGLTPDILRTHISKKPRCGAPAPPLVEDEDA